MKARKISGPDKGFRTSLFLQKRFYLSLMTLVAIVLVIGMIIDPDSAMWGMSGLGGTTFASMIAIGDIGDVSDRQTAGSNIAYKVYLIEVSQINDNVKFPKRNADREVGAIPMKDGQYMKYFEAHDIPTYTATGEKGDITTSGENNFVVIMGGMRDQLLNFTEQHAGGKFVILFKEVGEDQWYIIGEYDRPMILQSFEAKNDKDGRYVTFTFKRTSIDQYGKYVGDIVRTPAAQHAADTAILTIKPESNRYAILDGSTETYAINAISGVTANDKGRYITLEGAGADKAATIADGAAFVLEDGTTWTAKAGSQITFRIMDTATLVEVSGSRIQTA